MKVGIPKGLLYYKYNSFFESFFNELGAELITSEDTNKSILNQGTKYCVDEACLPIKIFHGHVASIKDKCDLIVIPRIMRIRDKEFICPKFCGLPEMVVNSIPDLPSVTMEPIYFNSPEKLYNWCRMTGIMISKDKNKIREAYNKALKNQKEKKTGVRNENYKLNVALVGHPYNLYDNFSNMDVVKKLNKYGVGIQTEETIDDESIDSQVQRLYKRPFWTFARNSYGFATHMASQSSINGLIYISSFACGIDSIVIELIKDRIGDFPFLILKIDEHTGEAGFDTRIEAFVDMLERRC